MLLSVQGVRKSFGIDIVLDGVSLRMDARQKAALVGRNGTGKTTLLKILTGDLDRDEGSVTLAKGAKVGYLKQEQAVEEGRTVLEEAQSAQADQLRLKQRMLELEQRLESGATEEEVEEYALVHEHFLEAEGYALESDVRTVLSRMGFSEDEFSKPTSVLSGGEKTRLAIARLLLEEPDLLILDEPTNHLDLQATEWLERWINAYHGAVLLVSHDRTFLENTVETFFDMRDGQVRTYRGGFDQYQRLKAEDDARAADMAAKQEAEIARLDEYVRRFKNSQRTAQAKGREKLMNRLIASKVSAPTHERGMAAGFGKVTRSGELVIECQSLEVGFAPQDSGDRAPTKDPIRLFPALDWAVRWGERWGVIGENGAGKSTLIKTVLGELDPLGGRSRVGANVVCGYFHQDVTDLDPGLTPVDYLIESGMDAAQARHLLGRFLITGDDAFRPVSTLSGGEKNKLVLARLTQLSPNLLVLDEPTNHLDMDSRRALAEVLHDYRGTLILVSHDRWLLSQTTDRILDVRRSGGVVYPGGYADYRSAVFGTPIQSAPTAVKTKTAKEQVEPSPGWSQRELSKEILRLEKVVEGLEDEVARAEQELKAIEKQLADLPPTADILGLTYSHRSVSDKVASALGAWEEQSIKLEELRSLQGPAGHVPGVVFRQSDR